MEKFPSGTALLNPRAILEGVGIAGGMRVADLGCGPNGFFVLEAARLVGEKGKVYGVDVRREVLESVAGKARLAGLRNVETVWSDLEVPFSTNIAPDSLDLTLLIDTLYLTKQRRQVVEEGLRLTRPGGKLLIIDWKLSATPLGPPTAQRVNRDEILALADSLGAVVRGAFEAGPYHWGVVFEKASRAS